MEKIINCHMHLEVWAKPLMYGCDQVGIGRGGCMGALGTRDLSVGQVSLAG